LTKTLDKFKIENDLERNGFSFLANISEEDLETIAESLGQVTVDPSNPDRIREIRPTLKSWSDKPTLSSKYGIGAFPFHTDCAHWSEPAEYLLLYCVNPGSGNRPTFLVDTMKWIWTETQRNNLVNEVWKRGLKNPRLCTLAEKSVRGPSIRFDRECMVPVTKRAIELLDVIDEKITNSAQERIIWNPGNLLILNNRRILHSRGASEKPDANRVLKRILVGGKS
jgi:L-asparagine oxygenase